MLTIPGMRGSYSVVEASSEAPQAKGERAPDASHVDSKVEHYLLIPNSLSRHGRMVR